MKESLGEEGWRGEMDAELEESKSARGGSVASVRVEWNVTGTVLSTVRPMRVKVHLGRAADPSSALSTGRRRRQGSAVEV